MAAFRDRISQRFQTDIPVLACNVVETRPARVVDISTHGAKIECDEPYSAGLQIALELACARVRAIVTWAEIDRMGVKFCEPLNEGAFCDALKAAVRRTSFHQPAAIGGVWGDRPSFGRRAA